VKRLVKYGNNRFRYLTIYLEKYKQDAKPEYLHQVRVELKKIKNLIDLLAFNSKQFTPPVVYEPLKNMFGEAGRIRESDVLHQLFKDYKLKKFEKEIIPEVRKKKNQLITAFHQKTKQYKKIVKQTGKKSEKYLAGVNRKILRKYILKAEHKLNKKMLSKFRQDELHKMRKRMKQIVFLSEIVSAKNIPKKIKLYNKVQNIIGRWHDKSVLIGLLKGNRSSSCKVVIRKLRSGCTRDIKLIKPLLVTLHHK